MLWVLILGPVFAGIATGLTRQVIIIAIATPLGLRDSVLVVVLVSILVASLPAKIVPGAADLAIGGLEVWSGAPLLALLLALTAAVATVDAAVLAFVIVFLAAVAVVTAVLFASVVAFGAVIADVRCCEDGGWRVDLTLLYVANKGSLGIVFLVVMVRLFVAIRLAVMVVVLAFIAALWL